MSPPPSSLEPPLSSHYALVTFYLVVLELNSGFTSNLRRINSKSSPSALISSWVSSVCFPSATTTKALHIYHISRRWGGRGGGLTLSRPLTGDGAVLSRPQVVQRADVHHHTVEAQGLQVTQHHRVLLHPDALGLRQTDCCYYPEGQTDGCYYPEGQTDGC